MNKRTGYKDRHGKTIRSGDTLEGDFNAPWDEEVWVTRRFRVVKDPSGRWLCDGIDSNAENDWLANYHWHLEVVKPACVECGKPVEKRKRRRRFCDACIRAHRESLIAPHSVPDLSLSPAGAQTAPDTPWRPRDSLP